MLLFMSRAKAYPPRPGKPMGRTRSSVEDLRLAIDCLPLRTREAMLAGIRSHEIIVGAYSDRAGGVCPMLAAHRCGGRTSFISFARAWDRFARAKRARTATARELRALEAHLIASILAESPEADLAGATTRATKSSSSRRSTLAAPVALLVVVGCGA